MAVVLASGSPRRTLLLSTAGIAHRVVAPEVDESIHDGETPSSYVLRVSSDKVSAVRAEPGDIVIGADTTVVHGGAILGKPTDEHDALVMLRRLVGDRHVVMTGWTIRGDESERFGVTESTVRFHDRTDDELLDYIERTEPFDKAGAYAIQGDEGFLVAEVVGSRSNVMGLPVAEIVATLADLGVERSTPHSG